MNALARLLSVFQLTALLGVGWASANSVAQDAGYDEVGGPLSVAGVQILPDEIKRFVIYQKFPMELDNWVDEALIDLEIEKCDPTERDRFQLMDGHLESELSDLEAGFKLRYPTLDWQTQMRRYARSQALFHRIYRQRLRFKRAYFPDETENWPLQSREATRQVLVAKDKPLETDIDDSIFDDFKIESDSRREDFVKRMEAWDGMGSQPELSRMNWLYRSVIRSMIRPSLLESFGYESAHPGLPAEFIASLRPAGTSGVLHAIRTEQLWSAVSHSVTDQDLWEIRQFLALIEATKWRLDRKGQLLPWDVAQARWKERFGEWDHSSLLIAKIQPQRAYAQIYESLYAVSAEALSRDVDGELPRTLTDLIQRYANHLNSVDFEVLLVAAFDKQNHIWKEDGWARARRKADRLAQELTDAPDSWPSVLAQHGEYWTFPVRVAGGCLNPAIQPMKAPVGTRQSHRYLQVNLGESHFTEFLTRDRLSDEILFNSPVGEITGPHRGPWGYYFVKVSGRNGYTGRTEGFDEDVIERFRQAWVRHALADYAHESLREADVVGLVEH